MKRKKGFTIVELAIVIAVVAILTAVLSPVFSSIISKANLSSDIQLVKNLNTFLNIDFDKDFNLKTNHTMYDALETVKSNGVSVDKIKNNKARNHRIVWDSQSDRFVLINEADGSCVYSEPDTIQETVISDENKYLYFAIYDEMPTIQTYSIYASDLLILENGKISELTVGFDAGSNISFSSLTYDRTNESSARKVIIRTNRGTECEYKGYIGTESDVIYHYGEAGLQKVVCGPHSFYERGGATETIVKSGHYVIESDSIVGVVNGSAEEGDVVIDLKSGSIQGTVKNTNTTNSVKINGEQGVRTTYFEGNTDGGDLIVNFLSEPKYTNKTDMVQEADEDNPEIKLSGLGTEEIIIPSYDEVGEEHAECISIAGYSIKVFTNCSAYSYSESKIVENTVKENTYTVKIYGNGVEEKFNSSSEHTHTFGEPSWEWNGYTSATATFICNADDCKFTEKVIVPTNGGDISGEETKSATCTEPGEKTYTAHLEHHSEQYYSVSPNKAIIPPKGHTEVKDEAKSATCTETGLTEGKHCSECKAVLVAQEEIPALGHDDNYKNGGTCGRCGKSNISVKFTNTDKYLYRVGNGNAVSASSLFEGNVSSIAVTNMHSEVSEVSGTYANGNITFKGTGIVKVTANESVELLLEVVDGQNVTTATSATSNNVILLNDVETNNLMVSSGYTLYGNGFKVTDTRTSGPKGDMNGYVTINNGTVDNVQFIGYEPTEQNLFNTSSGVWHTDIAPAVKVGTGGANIYNCYISGGRYALQADSCNLVMIGTTLDGGAIGNAYFVGGNITMENCITTMSTRGGMKGLGICIPSVSGVKLNIEDTLEQHNWATSSEVPSALSSLISSVYSNTTFAASYGGKTYINTGIFFLDITGGSISMVDAKEVINDTTGNNYAYFEKTALNMTGCCYTAKATMFSENMLSAPEFTPNNYATVPAVSFDHTVNYKANTGLTEDFCVENNGVVHIQLVKNADHSAFEWDPYIMTIGTKYGNTLDYIVKMNGKEYKQSEKISFSSDGDYDVEYIYTDPYYFDKDDVKSSKKYTQIVKVHVTTLTNYHPQFSYVGVWEAGFKQVIVDDLVYIMPDISSTATGQFGSTTVGGKTIYYPIVEVYARSSNKEFHAPAFSAINIKDLNKDTGAVKYTYSSSSSKWPHNGASSGGYSVVNKQPDDTTAYYGYVVTSSAANSPWHSAGVYANGGNSNATTGSNSSYGGLNFSSSGLNSTRGESTQLVKFWYRGDDGIVYYYYIQYHFPANSTYTVMVNCNVGGTVDHARIAGLAANTALSVDGNNLLAGGNVIATVTPNSAEYTVKWGTVSSKLTAHTTVNVDFVKACKVTIECGDGGSVDKQTISVNSGTKLTVSGNKLMNGNTTLATANPNTNYVAEWSVPSTAIADDVTIKLSFKPPVTITINCGTGGSVTNNSFQTMYNSTLTVDGNYLKNGNETLTTATPEDGYVTKWGIVPATVTGDTTIKVEFVSPVTITITAESNGSVTYTIVKVAPGKKLTTDGASLLYDGVEISKAMANSGYDVGPWSGVPTAAITADTSVSISFSKQQSCVAKGTLITLADGTQKPVEEIATGDMLLTWDLMTGSYSAKPVVFNDSEQAEECETIYVTFSDGTTIGIVSEHGFFDMDLGKYVYLDKNAAEYIDHAFIKQDGSTVTLTDVEIKCEVIECYSPTTFGDLCYYTNGILSMPGGISGLFNIFDVNSETMKYDEAQMQADIEAYGLLDIEAFGGMITEEMFEAFNGKYLGIAVGKGNLTWEYIVYLAERYAPLCN